MLYSIYKGGIGMREFFREHKKFCIIFAVVSVIVFAVYLFLLFKPGFWYRDAFLYKQKAPFEGTEVYSGKDRINDVRYEMIIGKEGTKTCIAFSVNETESYYEIISDSSKSNYPDVEIYENEKLVFEGSFFSNMLFNKNGEPFTETPNMNYYTAGELSEEELLPGYGWLYEISQRRKPEIRGDVIWLSFIVVFAGIIALDMIYPNLFWELRYRLSVEGGEPSDLYRAMQHLGWMLAPGVVIMMMIATFVI